MCDRVDSKNTFILKNCDDRYQTHKKCEIAVDEFLPALKFISNYFVTRKLNKKLHTDLFADDSILFFDEDSGNVIFSSDEMAILSIDLNNINLDVNFYQDFSWNYCSYQTYGLAQ